MVAPADRQRLERWHDDLLCSESDFLQALSVSDVTPYVDPLLLPACPSSYFSFLLRLTDANRLRFRRVIVPRGAGRVADHSAGIVFVAKRDERPRLVFDTRRANLRFRRPPTTKLPTPSSLSHLCTADVPGLYAGAFDVTNAFYQVSLPDHLSFFYITTNLQSGFR